ncbi:MAG: M1 family peptidase [Flavobacteriaceae bacterium]|nr:M1 family peptidase [Flavobacteriaceae bacterium]
MKLIICFFTTLLTFATTFAQQTSVVDFIQADADLSVSISEKSISGKVTYQVEILQPTDTVFLDAIAMEISSCQAEDSTYKLSHSDEKAYFIGDFQKGKTYDLCLNYKVVEPRQALYFVPTKKAKVGQVWTQGQGKYTSHWFPSIDDQNEKMIFNLSIEAPTDYYVLSNGVLSNKTSTEERTQWEYTMKKPMSSYLLALAMGDFISEEIESSSGVPIQLFLSKKYRENFEPTYRHTQQIFDFLEDEIGVAYPWEDFKQVAVKDFLYAGMENTGLTIFSEQFITDSIGFKDLNYVNVNAHELAHHWFGNLVTATESKHHWLHEGFATYYALLAEREIFGEEYFYFQLYQWAETLKAESDNGKGEALLKSNASSLTYYQKGAWALHILKEKVGPTNFNQAVKNYLEKYAYQNVTTEDFLREVEEESQVDLTEYRLDWLRQVAFPADQALKSLRKSIFIPPLLELISLRETDLPTKKDHLSRFLTYPVDDFHASEAVAQLQNQESPEAIRLYMKAFSSKSWRVRQAIANTVNKIPNQLLEKYESLLEDESYITQEQALLHLWGNVPSNRSVYLEKTKGIYGLYNCEFRMLWLMLALATQDFEPYNTSPYFEELTGYTNKKYPVEVRENAFNYLYQLDTFTTNNYKDLITSCFHFKWRYAQFSRSLLKELLKNREHELNIDDLKDELVVRERDYLKTLMNE